MFGSATHTSGRPDALWGVAPHEALNKGQRAARLHWLDVEPTTQLRGARTESSASVRVVIVALIMFVIVDARPQGRQPAEHAEIVQNTVM